MIDTNVVSELRKPRPHPGVMTWFGNPSDKDLHLSAATVCRYRARLMHKRQDDLLQDAMIAATAHVHGLTVVTRNLHAAADLLRKNDRRSTLASQHATLGKPFAGTAPAPRVPAFSRPLWHK